MKIINSIMTKNPCYTKAGNFANKKPKGLILHSVGCAQPSASVFIKGWNSASYTRACVHGFIDSNTGDIYQTLPWEHKAWHAGATYGNEYMIGVEMCESSYIKYVDGKVTLTNKEKAQADCKRTYTAAVELYAYLCKKFNLDPTKSGVILSHKEAHKKGWASNHGDPEHYWSAIGLGYTMDKFRKDVKAKMESAEAPKVESSSVTNGKVVKATAPAKSFNSSCAGTYTTTTEGLNMRNDAGASNKVLVSLAKGVKVKCYGYFSIAKDGGKWLLVQVTIGSTQYTGFVNSYFLKK